MCSSCTNFNVLRDHVELRPSDSGRRGQDRRCSLPHVLFIPICFLSALSALCNQLSSPSPLLSTSPCHMRRRRWAVTTRNAHSSCTNLNRTHRALSSSLTHPLMVRSRFLKGARVRLRSSRSASHTWDGRPSLSLYDAHPPYPALCSVLARDGATRTFSFTLGGGVAVGRAVVYCPDLNLRTLIGVPTC
jgi:hypothetical protein